MASILKRIKWKFFNRAKTTKDVFVKIHELNSWGSGKSVSGPGSEPEHIEKLIKELPIIFSKYSIQSILDAPCGDYIWMQKVDKKNVQYIGGDIVSNLVKENIRKYKTENISFIEIDLINDKLPIVDMVFVRDCFIHFSNTDLKKALKNIASSDCKYLFTTSYINTKENSDIQTGQWRRLNLLAPPFSLPVPDLTFIEESTEQNNRFPDKAMLLWDIQRLKTLVADF